jgi:hypothetical protein
MTRLERSADAAAAQRFAARAADIVDDAAHALGEDPRLVQVIGCRDQARQLAADVEDCLLALAVPGANAALGFAEKRLRDGVRDLGVRLTQARREIAATRDILLEGTAVVNQIRDTRRRSAAVAELDEALARHPDCSLGADLGAQHTAAQALVQRLRLIATAA